MLFKKRLRRVLKCLHRYQMITIEDGGIRYFGFVWEYLTTMHYQKTKNRKVSSVVDANETKIIHLEEEK